ncbi:TPA: anaerobic sulfatase maturase [Vibrio vulnificus]|uniref:anaerobic sulfatase maturase n=1 Tax=Vibrio vulnificus TaxID=672 RepID=UPI00092B4249|nr:anaerobic sulfatase maturase [Vibrio vulnificus]OJI58574.1 Anaerobic sulfatase-maturating enzyme [Vibrio fluvialis]POB24367.1 anaerobic sulfatase maturase [Vibrio vulnificus]HDY7743394.1 anaerobic sulfatase maturase [Vibrio vulnificus]HDY7780160.1 anaerobic sulfatase maturase [Vibrio vulnificus]
MQITQGPQFNGKASKRLHVMAKPIGAACNIDCTYCYYLSKQDLLEYKKGCTPVMDEATLETYIRQYIEGQNTPEIIFSWQGGEPTMLGLDYFRKIVEFQAKYQPEGVTIANDLQTNGTLLNDDWCAFLKAHNFLVGLSIDGPEMMHNAYRTNRAGRGTFKQVMNAVELLHKHQVPFATLTCVNNLTSRNPLEVYRFLRDEVRSPQMQFIPIVEQKSFRTTAPQTWQPQAQLKQGDKRLIPGHKDSVMEPWCVADEAWGNFLIAIFDEWIQHDIGKVFVQYFEASVETWMGRKNPLCTLGEICGKGLAMEPNGDVFACDHYVYPEYKIGNIHQQSLERLAYGDEQQKFGYTKVRSLTSQCQQCEYQFACFGECPKNRFIRTKQGEPGLNYLCAGWKKFFAHADKALAYVLRATGHPVVHGQYSDQAMHQLASRTPRFETKF